MTPAFLDADVCRALVEAGMVVEEHHLFWWFLSEGGWLLDCRHKPQFEGYTSAVTPLQALDWLVASGRIAYYIISSTTGIDCLASTADAETGCFEYPVKWRGTTPTDLVRAVLGMKVAA